MKTIEKSVKLAKEEVGPAQVPVLETEDDLQAYLDKVGIAKVLGVINAQVSTNICNALRGEHRESKPGKGKRYNTAFNVLPGVVFEDGETGLDKLQKCCQLPDEDGRKKAMDELLLTKEVQEAVDKKLEAAA